MLPTGYSLPWEDKSFAYPNNFALPVEIAIEASNGASDYGNKFGEPVLAGFARSFGMEVVAGDRREYVKPIMFSGGIGQLEGSHIKKKAPVKGTVKSAYNKPVYNVFFSFFNFMKPWVISLNKCAKLVFQPGHFFQIILL